MNFKKIIPFILLLIQVACDLKTTPKEENTASTFEPKDVLYKADTLKISLDDKTDESFEVYSNYKQGNTEYLITYDDNNHRLLNINLSKERVENTINLKSNGANGIGTLGGLYFLSNDSIFIYEQSRIRIINDSGEVIKSYDLTQSLSDEFGFLYTNYDFKLLYNKECNCVFLNNIFRGNRQLALKYPIIAKLDLKTSEIDLLNIRYSDYIRSNSGAFGHQFNINFNDTHRKFLYFTFPVESNIYEFDLSSGETKIHKAPSQNTANLIPPLNNFGDREQGEISLIENPYFYGVFFDDKNEVFYRIHREGKPFDIINDEFNAVTDVNFYVSIYDKNFNYIKEIELPENHYIQYSWFCSDGALYFSASNQNYTGLKEGIMEIHKYSFETVL